MRPRGSGTILTKELRKMKAEPSWAGIIELSQMKLQEKNASATGTTYVRAWRRPESKIVKVIEA